MNETPKTELEIAQAKTIATQNKRIRELEAKLLNSEELNDGLITQSATADAERDEAKRKLLAMQQRVVGNQNA